MNGACDFTFQSRIFIEGTIRVLTGLSIGGNSAEMGIGGADPIVVRDPLTNHPYIPGSSLRGKMRSLLERMRGEMTIRLQNPNASSTSSITSLDELGGYMARGAKLKSAGPSSDPAQDSTKLFGLSIDKQSDEHPVPQRLVVRDAKLLNHDELERAKNTDMPLTEVKTEVAIDRITSKANPRQIERVPAGAEFGFEMILNLYGSDDENAFLGLLFQCVELLQDNYLGGHGSRGYGRVAFKGISLKKKTAEDYRTNRSAQPIERELPEALRR